MDSNVGFRTLRQEGAVTKRLQPEKPKRHVHIRDHVDREEFSKFENLQQHIHKIYQRMHKVQTCGLGSNRI